MTTYDDLHDVELRVKDPATGGEKGTKATQLGALDPVALIYLGRVAGIGTLKYEAFNFLKGYDWAHSFNALMRHAMLFWAGEDIDWCTTPGHPVRKAHDFVPRDTDATKACDGTGLPHVALAAWHGHTLTAFWARGIGTDSRPPKLAKPSLPTPTRTHTFIPWPEDDGRYIEEPW
jgi:hypothetical protein